MWLPDTIHSFSIQATTPWYLQFHAQQGFAEYLESMQMMVDRIKTALEEAQTNLIVVQSWAKSQVDCLRCDGMFEVDDEVVLSTRNICVSQYLPSKLRRH